VPRPLKQPAGFPSAARATESLSLRFRFCGQAALQLGGRFMTNFIPPWVFEPLCPQCGEKLDIDRKIKRRGNELQPHERLFCPAHGDVMSLEEARRRGLDGVETPRKTMYFREGDSSPIYGWTIRYEGKLWLVPHWNAGPTSDTLRPARIISLYGLPVGNPTPPRSDCDLILSTPLSKHALEGHREEQNLLVVEQPPIAVKKTDVL